ncbi:MAG: PilZ domain-containing protein [Phycisphaerales bacterium]|nr:PilZ domain-containing protein [Phycisphaerales bacterium]
MMMGLPHARTRFIPDLAGVGLLPEPAAHALAKHIADHRPRLRGARRAALRVPCTIELLDETSCEAMRFSGHTVNYSVSGLAVMVAQALNSGTAVNVLLHAEGETRRISGTIAHCRQVLTGCFEIGIGTATTDSAT